MQRDRPLLSRPRLWPRFPGPVLFHRLKQLCQAVGGQFSLLWHNSHFTTAEDWELYRQVLVG